MTKLQKSLSNKYIFYKIFTNFWFVGAIWLYFYRLFITDSQIGLLDGIAFAIGLLAEIPSGALADKFGRDKLTKLGQVLAGSGLIIQALSSEFILFVFGQAVMMIGISFVSGADDALFYEELKFKKNSQNWKKLVAKASQYALVATLFAIISGGYLYSFNPRIPWLLTGSSFVLSSLLIWNVVDNRPKKARENLKSELKDYFLDIKTGFSHFKQDKLSIYIPFIISVQGLFYTFGYGLLKLVLLDRFGFSEFEGSLVIAASSLTTIGFLWLLQKYAEKFKEKRVLTVIGLIASFSLLASIFNVGMLGFLVIIAIYVGEHMLSPIMSDVLNNHAPEKQRATVLSIASFFKTLPYIFLAPIIGYLNTKDDLEYFLVVWSILIIISLIFYISKLKTETKVDLID